MRGGNVSNIFTQRGKRQSLAENQKLCCKCCQYLKDAVNCPRSGKQDNICKGETISGTCHRFSNIRGSI